MSISLENKSLMKENVPPDRTKRKTKEKQECLVKHANTLNVIFIVISNNIGSKEFITYLKITYLYIFTSIFMFYSNGAFENNS